MANEITLTASLSLFNPTVMGHATGKSVTGLTINQATSGYIEGTMSASTIGSIVPLGGVTTPHWAYFRNNDSINFVTIRNGLSGADLCKLLAGEESPIPLNDGAVIVVKANTAPVSVDYLIANL